jgi:ribose-phosphate pyrophosphokinase
MVPVILAGSSNVPLATAIAGRLGIRPLARGLDRYPDAELHVVLREPVREQDVFIVQPTSPPADEHLMELLFLADACRRAGAARVTAVVPYFAYARQDRRTEGNGPIGARVIAETIESVGISRVIALDLHTPELEGFFRIPMEHVSASRALAEAVRPCVGETSVLVAPDVGAARLAESFQQMLGCPMVVVRKSRLGRQAASLRGIVGDDLRGKSPIIIDDMISTGATVEAAINGLLAAGCSAAVTVMATHGLFVEDAIDRLNRLPIRQIVVTNSVHRPSPLLFPVKVVDVAGLLADTIARVHASQGQPLASSLAHA